ncbi:hypothetical protein NDU88_008477 [Pleurodeles waltl]|uniref:Uncharacterized protein n=1 Tax=Pleurodeles waltl TaxID=8319 RepID=A0AAV7P106_PLEWA|nr:hypothetical protein NDU88_008477 [Pleurodeles waltl]
MRRASGSQTAAGEDGRNGDERDPFGGAGISSHCRQVFAVLLVLREQTRSVSSDVQPGGYGTWFPVASSGVQLGGVSPNFMYACRFLSPLLSLSASFKRGTSWLL